MFWHFWHPGGPYPGVHDHHHNHHHINHEDHNLGGPYPDRQSWVLNDQVKRWRKQKWFDILYSLSSDWWLLQRSKQIFAMFISYHYQTSKINHLYFLPPGGKRLSTHWCPAQLARLSLTHRPEILVTLAHFHICIFAFLYIFIFAHLYICTFYFSLSTEHLFLQ